MGQTIGNMFKFKKRTRYGISTGKVAPAKIQQDLPAAKAVGEKAYEIFRVEQLESQPAITKFSDTIPKEKLQTFTYLNKKVEVKSKTSKEITLKADKIYSPR